MNGLRERILPDQGGRFALYLDLEAFPGAIGVNCDVWAKARKLATSAPRSSSAAA
jgi:hypothetical protein